MLPVGVPSALAADFLADLAAPAAIRTQEQRGRRQQILKEDAQTSGRLVRGPLLGGDAALGRERGVEARVLGRHFDLDQGDVRLDAGGREGILVGG